MKLQPAFFSLLLSTLLVGGFARAAQENAGDRPASPTDLQSQDAAQLVFSVEIESWTRPTPGWIYVLDAGPLPKIPGERVLLINPENGQQMGSIRTGGSADFALSPDGTLLYVAAVLGGDSSELAVIDTAQGKVLERATIQGRAVSGAILPFSGMAVSGDGSVLRILIESPGAGGAESFLLAAFDTRTGNFLPGSVHLGNCGYGRFISYPTANEFDFFCPRTNRVRLISADDQSRTLQNQDLVLPWERRIGVAAALEPPNAQEMAIVRGDGTIIRMNMTTLGFSKEPVLSGIPNRVPPAAWPTSPDGSKVYLGYRTDYDGRADNRFYLDYGRAPNVRPANETARQLEIFDTATGRNLGTIKTKVPFWSATISADGKLLYATAPEKHSILVLDTAGMRQVDTIHLSGVPALVLVAP